MVDAAIAVLIFTGTVSGTVFAIDEPLDELAADWRH